MQIWQSVSLTAVKRIYFCVKRGKKVAVGGTTVCCSTLATEMLNNYRN